MSLFRKLFNFNSKKNSDSETNEERGKFMPEIQLPVDEKFTINFKKNGGKFIYCDSLEEVLESFENILTENRWQVVKCTALTTNFHEFSTVLILSIPTKP